MNILKQIQQGDVWIEKVDNFVGHTLERTNRWGGKENEVVDTGENIAFINILTLMNPAKAYTIALGEATGHHHQLVAEREAVKVDMDRGIFELMEKAILTHEEHNPIELEAGLYRFGTVSYTHLTLPTTPYV